MDSFFKGKFSELRDRRQSVPRKILTLEKKLKKKIDNKKVATPLFYPVQVAYHRAHDPTLETSFCDEIRALTE